ncbi:MAG: hypothetical protein ACR2G4_10245 [Pyrinomonadaceae bacterium]
MLKGAFCNVKRASEVFTPAFFPLRAAIQPKYLKPIRRLLTIAGVSDQTGSIDIMV